MQGEGQEFIREWPPPQSTEAPVSADQESTAPKKLKIDSHVSRSSCKAFNDLVESPPSLKAETLLAKWWKERVKHEDKSMFSVNTNSKNPKTILFQLSR